jgi:stearoyl-CoA desaturase (Delta-9 desaturase)
MTCLVVTIPALATAGAIAWAIVRPIGCIEIGLFLLMWTLTGGFGVDVGYHRFLVHRSFEAKAVVRFILAAAGAMSFQGPPLYWAAVHRRHHEFSDVPGDPHSPNSQTLGISARIRDLWHAHIGWMANHDVPSTIHYVPDLLKDRVVICVNRYYLLIASAGLVLPAVAAGTLLGSWEGAVAGFLWGGLVRVFFASHATWSVNSICHVFGTQVYDCRDDSRNVVLLAIPTFGGSWHNNHHAFPTSARHGMCWWQLDLGYMMIWVMSNLGLVRNVRTAKR